MKKKIIAITSLILATIFIVIGIIYASHKAKLDYEKKLQEPLLDDISLEEITNENGLIFRIERNDVTSDCDSIFLEVYDDGTYKLTTTEITSNGNGLSHPILVYEEPSSGTYQYDIKDIFLELKQVSKKYYIITTGTNETYTTDQDNEKLREFLKEINVDLDTCMQSKEKTS